VNTVQTHRGHKRTDYRNLISYSQIRLHHERDILCRCKRISLYRGPDMSLARPAS
jgi:hypothetical protein